MASNAPKTKRDQGGDDPKTKPAAPPAKAPMRKAPPPKTSGPR